jgi:flagellar assembly factor FliW
MLANQSALQPTQAPPAAGGSDANQTLVIESRFGTLTVRPHTSLLFPQGLLGFNDFRDFALAELPDGKQPQFKALQCLTDANLAFLVAPIPTDSTAIDADDIQEACNSLSIRPEDLAIVLIVTVRRDDDGGAHVSVNLRAPVLIDTRHRVARQYVLPNNKYQIRHKL